MATLFSRVTSEASRSNVIGAGMVGIFMTPMMAKRSVASMGVTVGAGSLCPARIAVSYSDRWVPFSRLGGNYNG